MKFFFRWHNQPLLWPGNILDSCEQPKQLMENELEPCSALSTHDYFASSRVSYAVTFAVIGIFLLC